MRTMMILWLAIPAILSGQMPGVPVLQNGWATPGMVGAVNMGGGSGTTAWAAAVAWSPPTGRWQASGGVGTQSATGGGSHGVYGVRFAIPLAQMAGGKLGLAAFAGIGGAGKVAKDSALLTSLIPVGISIAFRQALGTRGFSIYATPSYQRATSALGSTNGFRVGTGVDVALTKSLGVTGGLEFGQAVGTKVVGKRSSEYGIGASYAFGKR